MSTAQISAFLKQQSRTKRQKLTWSIALSFSAGLLLIIQMGILAHIVSEVLTNKATLADVTSFLAVLPVLFLCRAALAYGAERVALTAAIDLKHQLRGELLSRLIARGPIIARDAPDAVLVIRSQH